MKHLIGHTALALCVVGCAGRVPNPVAVVNPSDNLMTWPMNQLGLLVLGSGLQ